MDAIETVQVEFSCPNCGAEGYEESFNASEIAKAAQVSFRCDECPATIYVDADVRIQARVPEPERAS